MHNDPMSYSTYLLMDMGLSSLQNKTPYVKQL